MVTSVLLIAERQRYRPPPVIAQIAHTAAPREVSLECDPGAWRAPWGDGMWLRGYTDHAKFARHARRWCFGHVLAPGTVQW